MSESKDDNRVRMGPEALQLIEGRDGTKQDALEDAIRELKRSVQHQSHAGGSVGEPTNETGASQQSVRDLATRVARLERCVSEMTTLVAAEMKMTRLLVGVIGVTSSGEQQQLRHVAAGVISKIVDRAEMLTESDRLELDRLEQEFMMANRLTGDRTYDLSEDRQQPEALER